MRDRKPNVSIFRDYFNCLVSVFFLLLLVACGGGGSSSSSSGDAPEAAVMQGTFLDSPVAGLYYETDTLDGYTDAEGTFLYREGETVAFYLQNMPLGQAPAVAVLTPIEIVPGAEDETHPTVTNLCLFLQSLDEDGDLENGILLSEAIGLAIEGRSINLNQPTSEFIEDPDLIDLLQYLNNNGAFTDSGSRELRTPEEAQAHLLANLADQECGGADSACPEDESDYESSLRDLISDYRQQNGLGRLAFDAPLHDLAQEHSENMQTSGVMSHDGFTERYNRSGYGVCVENVGWNYPTPEAMFEGWRNSSGHNTNMLNSRIEWAGVSREGAYITFFACGN